MSVCASREHLPHRRLLHFAQGKSGALIIMKAKRHIPNDVYGLMDRVRSKKQTIVHGFYSPYFYSFFVLALIPSLARHSAL